MCIKIIFADTLPQLARITVEEHVLNAQPIILSSKCLVEYREQRAGVFVTIYKNKQLRGCIGTMAPTQVSVINETIMNSISACCRDWRFEPVKKDELKDLTYSVNILMPSEQIDSTEKLDPQKYGVIVVAAGNKKGVLLPRLEGIKTVDEQMYHVMLKAGIRPDEIIILYRFESIEHKE